MTAGRPRTPGMLGALLLGLAGLLAACQPLPPAGGPPAPAAASPEIIGELRTWGPNVTVNGTPAADGRRLRRNDFVATGPNSRARVQFTPGGFVQLEENTDPNFLLDLLDSGRCLIKFLLRNGSAAGDTDPCSHEVTDASGNDILAGSQYILTATPEASVLTLLDGSARVRGARTVTVQAGQQVVMTRDFISEPRRLSSRELRRLRDWLKSFDFTGAQPALRPVPVPRLNGLQPDRARRLLQSADLALGQVLEQPSTTAPPGTIIDQRPRAGTRVPPGTGIYVQVAVPAKAPLRAPNLRGLTVPDAERRLAQARLRLGTVTERPSEPQFQGTILSQNPGPGVVVQPGTAVNVEVGIRVQRATVPTLQGLARGDAERRLRDANLRPGRVTEQLIEKGRDGTVIAQRFSPGTTLAPGTPVDLTVAIEGRRVPTLTGVPLRIAQSRLSVAGLPQGQIVEQVNLKVPPGTVIGQSARAGLLVRIGSKVGLTVAKGLATVPLPPQPQPQPQPQPKICTAPKIDGLTFEQAKKLLAERGLQGRVRGQYGFRSNVVYRQDPAPGGRFPCDQPITFDLGTIG